MKALITGGNGYIGSVLRSVLQDYGSTVVVWDIADGNRINDSEALCDLVAHYDFDVVFHLAAETSVFDSERKPALFWRVNVDGSRIVFDAAKEHGVPVVFSSSAAVYGRGPLIEIDSDADNLSFDEQSLCIPDSVYGWTKFIGEQILESYHKAYNLPYCALRYFNVAGAYKPSDRIADMIGQYPPYTHLIPNIIESTFANKSVSIFGTDYSTPDGTCVRDYIHVEDVALAHIKSYEALCDKHITGKVVNIGSGEGYSVRQMIDEVKKYLPDVQYEESSRRDGDSPILVADTHCARKVLDWKPKHCLTSIVQSAIEWHESLWQK